MNVIPQAFCEEGKVQDNGVLAFAKFVIFPLLAMRNETGKNTFCRREIE